MPKISVIIPVYNAEKYLRNCLDSLLKQSFQDFEVIIVNDGSTDGSACICDEYKNKDKRIIVIHQNNEGVSNARNTAIREVNGEWLFFLDADDELFQDSLENLYNHTHNADMVIGECEVYNYMGIRIFSPPKRLLFTYNRSNALHLLYRPKFIYQGYLCNKLYKSSIVAENNIYFNKNISFGEDKLFIVQFLCQCNNVVYTSQPVYKYLKREESAMGSINKGFNNKYISSFHAEVESYNTILRTNGIKKEIKHYSQESIVESYLNIVSHIKRFSVKEENVIKELKAKMNNIVPKLTYYRLFMRYTFIKSVNKAKIFIRTILSRISPQIL